MQMQAAGLIKYGSALVPFINRFPQNTKLYELMTTRPGEGQFGTRAGVILPLSACGGEQENAKD